MATIVFFVDRTEFRLCILFELRDVEGEVHLGPVVEERAGVVPVAHGQAPLGSVL